MGSTSDSDNRDEIYKSQNEKVVSPKRKRAENINRGNENYVEKLIGKKSINDAGNCSYNRFTLLNELVREEELNPSVAQRKIINEYMNKERNKSGIRNQGWRSQKIITNGEPWVTLGDFNVTLKVEEHSNGSSIPSNEMNELAKTLKKLDRILINEAFMDKFQTVNGMFLPYLISNHSPIILRLPNGMARRKKAFRFSNFVTDKKEFLPIVKKAWEVEIEGNMMYRVVKKLKLMKPYMNKLSWKDGNIFERVTKLRECLKNIQAKVDKYPHNEDIKVKSFKILSEYYVAMKDENNLLMQKSKMEWLKDGKKDVVTEMPKDRIVFPNKLSFEETVMMCKDVSEVEVKNAMFDIEDSKAPGPDVKDFSMNGKLLGEDFLRVVSKKFGFPEKMVKWIMVCVSTTKFSININGEIECYFTGGRGLRQGDPMSPYPFTLVMEAFNLIMRRNINDNKEFKYHRGFQKLGITHLCFADDLLVFCHGDHKSASAFLLPKNVIYEINKLLKGFLWCQEELTRGKAKVSWKSVCRPKEQDGLGIKNLQVWNEVLLIKQLWNVIAKNDTHWVNWINMEYLKGKSVWVVSAKASSVGWKEMLKLRDKSDILRIHNDTRDKAVWLDRNGKENMFSVRQVWKDFNYDETSVDWYKIIWFEKNIPRHAYVVWMAIQNRLSTQDRIAIWKANEKEA
uniref:Reverse transcriptase domain-containing protein n=1 Tax=Tanacetum cinerariifolium TaxID=118510 RepID=A0A699I3R4_TANCI|nr:hypothetical protein [Tanacetum cinerariifolium]